MIIYGTKGVPLKSIQPKSGVCPNCRQTGTVVVTAYSKHVHLFWIPIFPYQRSGIAECTHCKSVLKVKEIPPDLKSAYANLKAETQSPLWQFSGLGLIGLLIVIGNYVSNQEKKNHQEYLKNPAVGDVYKVKTQDGQYTTAKVAHVSDDSIYVTYNQYLTNKMSGVSEIDVLSNYDSLMYGMSRNEVQEMYASEQIYDIDRNLIGTVNP